MIDELETLKRITQYIREARDGLREDLERMDYEDLARVVPADNKRENDHA